LDVRKVATRRFGIAFADGFGSAGPRPALVTFVLINDPRRAPPKVVSSTSASTKVAFAIVIDADTLSISTRMLHSARARSVLVATRQAPALDTLGN